MTLWWMHDSRQELGKEGTTKVVKRPHWPDREGTALRTVALEVYEALRMCVVNSVPTPRGLCG